MTRWTDEQDDLLREAWNGTSSRRDIGSALGRTPDAIGARAATLGLPRYSLLQQPSSHNRIDLPQIETRDEDHQALAIAQGGFPTAVIIDGKTCWIDLCGRSWVWRVAA